MNSARVGLAIFSVAWAELSTGSHTVGTQGALVKGLLVQLSHPGLTWGFQPSAVMMVVSQHHGESPQPGNGGGGVSDFMIGLRDEEGGLPERMTSCNWREKKNHHS